MQFGLIIIGTEILTGKRQDKHFSYVIQALAARGYELAWALTLGDVSTQITDALRRSFGGPDAVFCFGGIGATPDDYTRQCAAEALGSSLVRHPQAVAEIEAQYGAQAYPNRILMADLPADARIIPNPRNRVPGFSCGRHHFFPGFPSMAWPMLEWVLDSEYGSLAADEFPVEVTLIAYDARESELLALMEDFVARFQAVRFSSLPSIDSGNPHIEFGVRGRCSDVPCAIDFLRSALISKGLRVVDGPQMR